jgi:ubiquinol-cytochrome c reductase cytochrome b subunit
MTDSNGGNLTASAVKSCLYSARWGGRALISLYISALSGLALGLQYNSAEPFYSTATIQLVIPFGAFWRSLHYCSSQAFFLFLLIHLTLVIGRRSGQFSPAEWLRLTASAPVSLSLLFTGYILRGDATGDAAGAISEHIALSITLFGQPLNKVLLDISAAGLRKIYLHHAVGLMLLGAFCLWPHLRRYPAFWRNHLPLTLLLLAAAALIKIPLEPERFGLLHIAGPWFFVGMQELLRHLPAFWAGAALPAALIGPLLLLPAAGRARNCCLSVIAIWLLGYAAFSGLALARL